MVSRKLNIPVTAMHTGNYSVHISKRSNQNGNYPGSDYSMFDGPQAEVEHMNRPLINPVSGKVTNGEEFHWMANAAYNQSK